MNMKVLAFQLGALGSTMASGGGAAALVLPAEIDPVWAKTIRNICVVVWLLGGGLSVFSKWMMATIKAAEDAETNGVTQTVQLPSRPTVPPVAIILIGFVLLGLSGCSKATPTYAKATHATTVYYDVAYQNLSAQFDEQQRALLAAYSQKKDVELSVDLKSLAYQAQLNPTLWTPANVAGETTRLQALRDAKIAEYAASLQNFASLKAKNEATNLANAHKLRDVLNPPLPPSNAPTDLTTSISAAAGTPAPVPIFSPATPLSGK